MRYILAAAVVAGLSAGAAQAATVDLTYTVEAEVTSFSYTDTAEPPLTPTPYNGPVVGDVETRVFTITLDPEEPREGLGRGSYRDFDPIDGSAIITLAPFADENSTFDLTEMGTGTIDEIRVINPQTDAFVRLLFDVRSWSVEGLPEQLAPVPLPATLPLLVVGMGAVGLVARRRKTTRAAADNKARG